jgi:eukaryotic-like serine/threonine-protein kinase
MPPEAPPLSQSLDATVLLSDAHAADSALHEDSEYWVSDLLPCMPTPGEPVWSAVGRYELRQRLGDGGLGCVHQAWDPLLSRDLAIKTLRLEAQPLRRRTLDTLFLNEARAAAGLSHPYIVTVYDAGLCAQGVFIAMEALKGQDLRRALAEGWRPAPHRAARLARRVADALAYAHARGVVHCDIKPANIYVTAHEKPRVLDFGIARVAHRVALPELEGLLMGSPHYMAPEQILRGAIDARSDVFSLGAVLYEMLAGHKAFEGESVHAIHLAVAQCRPKPLEPNAHGVDAELAAIVHRALARDPEARFASAREFSQGLRCWAQARKQRRQRAKDDARVTAAHEPQLPPHAWAQALTGWMRRLHPAGSS